ncbi:cobyrinic acid a,c-diamide synthase [Granulicella arctica]|uniref:Cobyrinic acid a,c-diamide synthase n=2 Tax=Granulicella arctica TaxID=940613 RepID=A0A7Y9TH09_9BACT|nr:cobyrinic acid a,c-diamide synthase [Granulicella arctica]
MLSAEANKDVLYQASQDAEAVVVEGMMGLFDGKDGATETGSSAEIAKLLQLPVVLVLDAGKSARSIAAVVLGFELFDATLPLAGIILNRVASEPHFKMLETAILSACRTPILGWLPREPSISISERHLGLRTAEEFDDCDANNKQIDALAALAESHLKLDHLLRLECGLHLKSAAIGCPETGKASIRVGVARDRAFSFYYEDNLDLLRHHGAEIIPFSPMLDSSLPADLDALYLGGGYPELYAQQLSANLSMHTSIRHFVASRRPVYAECGGMIYLAQHLATSDGKPHAMAGVLPFTMEMTNKLVQFGYVTVELAQNCLLGPRGTVIRGHSFHYSRIVNAPTIATNYRVLYSISGRQEDEGYSIENVIASYIHLHFRAAPIIAQHFVEAARKLKARQTVPA